ncbi:unnamed protein product [Ascophyllum nodosum]
MRRSRGGQPDGDINIANSAGKMLQGLGWREWCGGEGQARRRRVAGIMLLLSAACASGFAIRGWVHAPVGRGDWRSASSLRYVDELPKSLAVDPQQLAPGEDVSIQELTPQTSMPPNPEHPQQLQETPEAKHPQRLQETTETEHPQQLQETPETEHPQQLQETPETEHPQQLQETPETEHPQQLQETPETEHPQQLQESLETERPQQLQETPETEPPQQLETLEEESPHHLETLEDDRLHQLGTLEDRGTSSGGQSLSAMLTLLEGSYEDLPVEAMRDYLNGLIDESVSRTPYQLSNIAFIKTHKTASTTLASILYRYGMRHGSNIAQFYRGGTFVDLDTAVKQVAQAGKRVDIMHYHHAWNGFYSGTWEDARSKYARIMSDQNEVNYVTVLREPIGHYLSYYYYFLNPINQMSIEDYLLKNPHKKLLYNPLAAEFGIENMEQMSDFIRTQLPMFKMVLLTERFDEGLALLQKMLGWEPIDMTYCKMLQTKKGEKRWDGKPLQNVPKASELPPEVLSHIKARTQLDVRLYQAGILLARGYKLDVGPLVGEHFQAFQGVQKVMHRYLEANTSSDALKWYVGDVDIYDHGPPVLRF